MRLVDADALKEEIEFHPTSVSVCMTVAEAKGQTYFKNRCLDDIDAAPTIAAIPVEWLKAHKTEYLDDWGEEPVSVEAALRIWQKEQEAQDG